MQGTLTKRILSLLVSLSMVFSVCVPSIALAQASDVLVENHTREDGRTTISNVRIDGVSAPQAGSALDDTATVKADSDATWDIPVLWVRDDLTLAAEVEEGRTYLPALAFFVPEDYALAGENYKVTLSDSLTALFGGEEVISVYNAGTGITYILPASIRDFFSAGQSGEAAAATSAAADGANTVVAPAQAAESQRQDGEAQQQQDGEGKQDSEPQQQGDEPQQQGDEPQQQGDEPQDREPQQDGDQGEDQRSVIDIYCAQTAKDVLTDEDLEWLIDLIINKLEPQAVELLLDSFPAFRAGAENDEIGREIGLYIYYLHGDRDGLSEHESASSEAMAYVSGQASMIDGAYKYCYMLGVHVDDLLEKDDEGNAIRDSDTGKFRLLRDGDQMRTLENTIVHELFHALMDDYNRTGMAGVTNINDYVMDKNGNFSTPALNERYKTIRFPTWFIEGTASSVENTYQFRRDVFDGLRRDANGKLNNLYTAENLLYCYLDGKLDGEYANYDLGFCNGGTDSNGHAISNTPSAYVCGYLASLYLAELANIKNTGSSAITIEGDKIQNVSTEKLRLGLDSILERTHKGETLDQVINDISPVDDKGAKLYTSADDFQNKFIKGPQVGTDAQGNPTYNETGDGHSIHFVADYLNYLLYVTSLDDRTCVANGSILFPVDEDFHSPLDASKESSSDFLRIVDSNQAVESTVPDSIALAGGGKSDPDTTLAAASLQETPKQEEKAAAPSRQGQSSGAAEGQATGTTQTQTAAPAQGQAAAPAQGQAAAPAQGQAADSAQQVEAKDATDNAASDAVQETGDTNDVPSDKSVSDEPAQVVTQSADEESLLQVADTDQE